MCVKLRIDMAILTLLSVQDTYAHTLQTPSGAGVDALTARSSSPAESWESTPYRQAELLQDGDIEELSKQLEMER